MILKDTYSNMIDNISSLAGNGLLWILLLICLLALLVRMKNSPDKHLLVWYPLFVLAVYFCPVWVVFFLLRDDGVILYRIMWLVPFSVIICYTLVEAIHLLPAKYKPWSFVACVLLIILCGNYIYDNPGFSKAENEYHVPQTVVDICETVQVPGREIKICVTTELLEIVRQYSPIVVLAYGRTSLLTGTVQETSDAWEAINSDVIDAERLCRVLRETQCCYVVIPSDRPIKGSLAEYDFFYVKTVDNYDIYLDNHAYLGLWGLDGKD